MKPILIKEKYTHFRAWQQLPRQVAPLSDTHHDCPTCGTHYQGNYCPRCGQSAQIGRYSAKKAFLLFLDVWGLGNRGMFRTLRDLMLRPGYMIRDYLQGMQMAYFPPFKMFFLLVALSLLVDSGLNIQGKNNIAQVQEDLERGLEAVKISSTPNGQDVSMNVGTPDGKDAGMINGTPDGEDAGTTTIEEETEEGLDNISDEKTREILTNIFSIIKRAVKWFYDNQTFVRLILLLLISGPLYLAFRRCPNIPDLRFSEFFVAMIYSSNMITIIAIICSFFCMSDRVISYLPLLATIPLKQLTGYSYLNTAFRATCIVLFISSIIVITGILLAVAFGMLMAKVC